jgi:hypothetical protein
VKALALLACLALAACSPSRDTSAGAFLVPHSTTPSATALVAVTPSVSTLVGQPVTVTVQATPAVKGIVVLFDDNSDVNGPNGLGSATTDASGRASVVAIPTRTGTFSVTVTSGVTSTTITVAGQ